MENKLKIRVRSGDQIVNLPAMQIKTMRRLGRWLFRLAVWVSSKQGNLPDDIREQLLIHKEEIYAILDLMEAELIDYEPFTLIEVTSGEDVVLIDVC